MFGNFTRAQSPKTGNVVPLQPKGMTPPPAAPAAPREPSPEDTAHKQNLELKSRLHDMLLDRMNLAVIDKIQPGELKQEVAALVSEELAKDGPTMSSEAFKKLIDELIDEVLGLGPLEPLLADPTISDILVNGHRDVFVERGGMLEVTSTRFRDEKHLLRIIDKIVSRVGRRIDESNPWVDARLADGSRVNAIIRPCAIDGPSMSIRKFSSSPLTMDKLVGHGALSGAAAEFLQAIVAGRMNILISGGTGSGKTTMLNAMSASIGKTERIVTIEDAAELQLQQRHVVRLETKTPTPSGGGAVDQRDLLKNALRMRPDRIIVGEVRGAETFDMLQAMNTGHDGSMTTVHANTARDAIGRVEQMVTMIGIDFPLSAIRSQIASGLNFVVQLNRLADGQRKVMSISEITGLEGDIITMQDIFCFRKNGKTDDGKVLGEFVATGIRPACWDKLIAAGCQLSPESFIHRSN